MAGSAQRCFLDHGLCGRGLKEKSFPGQAQPSIKYKTLGWFWLDSISTKHADFFKSKIMYNLNYSKRHTLLCIDIIF